jgi:hypothetical protein
MKLALSRDLPTSADQSAASALAATTVTPSSHFSDLLASIVTTKEFLQQTGEAP